MLSEAWRTLGACRAVNVGIFSARSHQCSFLSISAWVRRDKEHSTIIYESSEPNTPLLRLGWNKQDPRYMATILMDSSKARVGASSAASMPDARRSGVAACCACRSCHSGWVRNHRDRIHIASGLRWTVSL